MVFKIEMMRSFVTHQGPIRTAASTLSKNRIVPYQIRKFTDKDKKDSGESSITQDNEKGDIFSKREKEEKLREVKNKAKSEESSSDYKKQD